MGTVVPFMRSGLGLRNDCLTPLRYAGGKVWFIPRAEMFIQGRRPEVFIEPFAGEASVGLTLLHRGLIDRLVMAELDPRVGAFWRRALNDPSFADEVESFTCTRQNVEALIADRRPGNLAMWVLVKNRCSFGGVLSGAGLKRDVAEKWLPHLTAPALRRVFELKGRISLIEGDGIQVLREHNDGRAIAFTDPPYSLGHDGGPGRHLYAQHRLNHEELFDVLSGWSGPWLATYNDCPEVRDLVSRHGLQAKLLRMVGNTGKRRELVIGPDLSSLPGRRLRKISLPGISTGHQALGNNLRASLR